MKWTPEDDKTLKDMYPFFERKEIAARLGRTIGSIRKRCSTLGLNSKHPSVTEAELEKIKDWYERKKNEAKEDFVLDELSGLLGRTKQFISRLAGKMGLTTMSRRLGSKQKERISEGMALYIKENGHPKGMLGKQHTDEWKAKQSIRVSERVYTEEQKERKIERMMNTKIERYGSGRPPTRSNNPYSRSKRGKREDLGNIFFRSSWEANYARYLNWLVLNKEIKSWEFEPQTFVFHGETRGAISYLPDFKIINNNGSHEWHEVKGWMTPKDRTKLKRMAKHYPDEKVVLIDGPVYKEISKWKSMIPGWE